MKYITIILFLFVGTLFFISNILINKVLLPPIKDLETTVLSKELQNIYPTDLYESVKKEKMQLEMNGYIIDGEIIKNEQSSKTVILLHGHGTNSIYSIAYLGMFYDLGYNVVVYDHRASGKTGGKYCTMGALESDDLDHVIRYVKKELPQTTVLGLHGVSMGGSTALIYGATYGNLDFIISDCAYSSLEEELKYQLNNRFKMPPFPLIPMSNFLMKLKTGLSYTDLEIKELVKSDKLNDTDVLIIHGGADDYTPPYMASDIYENLNSKKQIKIFPEAGHAHSFELYEKEYIEEVAKFLSRF